MNEAHHSSWYARFNVQDLNDCLSSRFGSEEFLQPPFFTKFVESPYLQADIDHVSSIVPVEPESQTRLVEVKNFSDPKSWSYGYKVLVSILLNAFPLVVAIGTSILSPVGKDLVREFDTKSELAVLTTSLYLLVRGKSLMQW